MASEATRLASLSFPPTGARTGNPGGSTAGDGESLSSSPPLKAALHAAADSSRPAPAGLFAVVGEMRAPMADVPYAT